MKGGLAIKLSICLLVFVALGYGLYALSKDAHLRFQIAANEPRPWAETAWKRFMEDTPSAPAGDAGAFFNTIRLIKMPAAPPDSRITRSQGLGETWIYQATAPDHQPYSEFYPADHPSPPLKLHAIGMNGWFKNPQEPPPLKARAAVQPMRFYDPVTSQRMEGIEPAYSNDSPIGRVELEIRLKADGPVGYDSAELFDNRTHADLSLAPMRGKSLGEEIVVSAVIYSYRPSGVMLPLNVSLGSLDYAELPARENAEMTSHGQTVRILAASSLEMRTVSFMMGPGPGGMRTARLTVITGGTVGLPTVPGPFSNYILAAHPYTDRGGLQFQAFDAAGAEIPCEVERMTGMGYRLLCKVELGKVDHFKVSGPSQFIRQIVALPPLPEMPKENDSITNMMDMKVPYVRLVKGESALPEIGFYAQLRVKGQYPYFRAWQGVPGRTGPPPDELRVEYENLTVRQLCQMAALEAPPGKRLTYSPDKFEISFEAPPKVDWMQRIRDWFRL